jgi:D-glycero-D-manno-heptose 1,7-bisphosphate phosphatase
MGKHKIKLSPTRRAVFLDRDGVLDALVFNAERNEYEPPHSPEELTIFPGVISSLKRLQAEGYILFLISNQPDYALGKAKLSALKLVHSEFSKLMEREGVHFKRYYYCYHHPNGIVLRYSFECVCRKPKPFFLIKASRDYNIDLSASWMIGDTDKDVKSGRAAGVRTILVDYELSSKQRTSSNPDYEVKDLNRAIDIIIDTDHTG